MDKETLMGKRIAAYLDGGWEVSGIVRSFSKDRFVLETGGDLYLVFKSKVSAILIEDEKKDRSAQRDARFDGINDEDAVEFPANSIEYGESSMSIPKGLLTGADKDVGDNTFSSFFPSNTLSKSSEEKASSGINFMVKDDSDE